METIVMIHGMWCGAWSFDEYKAFFEEKGYRVVVPTLPYHDVDPNGPPHPEVGTASLQDYADYLEAEIRKLNVEPIIIGHSMGGLLAQILAARGVGKAHALLTTAWPWGTMALPITVIRSFWEATTRWAHWRRPYRQSYETAVYALLHQYPEEERKRIYSKLVYESGWVIVQIGFWPVDFNRGSYVDETKVTKPMLVIGGGQDRITPASMGRRVAAKYARVAEYREFPDQAHFVLSQPGWQDVAWAVHDWLKTKGL